jgi:hypothetical protein
MREIIIAVILSALPAFVLAADFVHPLEFKDTKAEKERVINFIKENVKATYTKIGMGDPLTLRMMEKEELQNFKNLIKVKNRKLLDNVITQYCNIGMCNYNTIFMMYNEQLNASKKSLSW